jgi:hypothetical protein
MMAPNRHAARIGRLRQPPDQGELGIGAFAAHDDLDPVTEPADMGIAQPMRRRRQETFERLVEAHARRENQ